MAKSSQDMSSRRQFHWTTKVSNEEEEEAPTTGSFKTTSVSSTTTTTATAGQDTEENVKQEPDMAAAKGSTGQALPQRRKLRAIAVSRLQSVLTAFSKNRLRAQTGLGPRVVGTLFGYRRGHVHFAFQRDPSSAPAFLIELSTPITGLVREMASGLLRIALECDKDEEEKKSSGGGLLEEPLWRTYCNGKRCGFSTRRECGPKDWKVLKAVEPISMGAGVLPRSGEGESEGELMYMRAKFERVVGSRDSEAFYMMNPDSNGAPELSIYLLRV